MGYAAKILADSITNDGHRLTTFEVTFPRIVLAEFNTHRMLSRNSASSRAIPVEKRIQSVLDDPFIPESFGKNQRGMQASVNLDEREARHAREIWCGAMNDAVVAARQLAEIGAHKQLANRVLEPFLWHTVIVSATEWDNLWALRCSDKAQPEIRKPIEMMRDLMGTHAPRFLKPGEWHVPMVDEAELEVLSNRVLPLVAGPPLLNSSLLVSAGRCARVSYLTHDGKRDTEADIELARKLAGDGHMSPFEHVAEARSAEMDGPREFWGNFRRFKQLRKSIPNEHNFALMAPS